MHFLPIQFLMIWLSAVVVVEWMAMVDEKWMGQRVCCTLEYNKIKKSDWLTTFAKKKKMPEF